MQTHGYVTPGELIGVAIMLILAIGAVVFAFIAGINHALARPSFEWWSYAGMSAGGAFLAWLFT